MGGHSGMCAATAAALTAAATRRRRRNPPPPPLLRRRPGPVTEAMMSGHLLPGDGRGGLALKFELMSAFIMARKEAADQVTDVTHEPRVVRVLRQECVRSQHEAARAESSTPELGLSSSRIALQLAPRIVATESAAVSSALRCSTIGSTLGGLNVPSGCHVRSSDAPSGGLPPPVVWRWRAKWPEAPGRRSALPAPSLDSLLWYGEARARGRGRSRCSASPRHASSI